MTFESELFMGKTNIVEKLQQLNVSSKFGNYEIQPSINGLVIYLSGGITIAGESNEIPFTRVFVLTTDSNGSFYGNYFLFFLLSF